MFKDDPSGTLLSLNPTRPCPKGAFRTPHVWNRRLPILIALSEVALGWPLDTGGICDGFGKTLEGRLRSPEP